MTSTGNKRKSSEEFARRSRSERKEILRAYESCVVCLINQQPIEKTPKRGESIGRRSGQKK